MSYLESRTSAEYFIVQKFLYLHCFFLHAVRFCSPSSPLCSLAGRGRRRRQPRRENLPRGKPHCGTQQERRTRLHRHIQTAGPVGESSRAGRSHQKAHVATGPQQGDRLRALGLVDLVGNVRQGRRAQHGRAHAPQSQRRDQWQQALAAAAAAVGQTRHGTANQCRGSHNHRGLTNRVTDLAKDGIAHNLHRAHSHVHLTDLRGGEIEAVRGRQQERQQGHLRTRQRDPVDAVHDEDAADGGVAQERTPLADGVPQRVRDTIAATAATTTAVVARIVVLCGVGCCCFCRTFVFGRCHRLPRKPHPRLGFGFLQQHPVVEQRHAQKGRADAVKGGVQADVVHQVAADGRSERRAGREGAHDGRVRAGAVARRRQVGDHERAGRRKGGHAGAREKAAEPELFKTARQADPAHAGGDDGQ